jgi:hypothetical protein
MKLDYLIAPNPFALSLMELLAIRLSPQAGKSLVMSKGERSCFDKLSTNGCI